METDNFLGFGKKAKAKRVTKTGREKSRAGKTMTDILNGITGKNKSAKRSSGEQVEDIYQLPRLQNRVSPLPEIKRTVGVYEDSLSIDEKMKTPGNIARGLINREIGIAYNTPFGEEGTMRDFVMTTNTKKNKNNVWMYLLLAAVVGFAIYKMTAKK